MKAYFGTERAAVDSCSCVTIVAGVKIKHQSISNREIILDFL
ncbi:hypothetical protein HMPREF0574_0803 [Mobiluncus curtisii subsp. curtisii ATCC 35241]|uniref:Uncharacterized protein n=1 Tax=Mobiluncus curtisii (strain ATCC 43063 / DSM 2711 / V125) TaxID=548479 RepID=D6ZKW3_MOBCV|nr:hypothetical protein HMPREF0573_11043 [Mobiluncus curtisii ATCC 43063]EFL93797.1 hypothetical protein HMPREF0574_0803 [Mobiluncus curtisii subsp. curtisii ATCC 35241]